MRGNSLRIAWFNDSQFRKPHSALTLLFSCLFSNIILAMVPGPSLSSQLIYSFMSSPPPHSNPGLFIYHISTCSSISVTTLPPLCLPVIPPWYHLLPTQSIQTLPHLKTTEYRWKTSHNRIDEYSFECKDPVSDQKFFSLFLIGHLTFPRKYFKPSHLPMRNCNSDSSILTSSWWICLWFHSLWTTCIPYKLTRLGTRLPSPLLHWWQRPLSY